MIAVVDSRTWWWLTRAAGIVALALMAAAVTWGLLASTKLIRRKGLPAWILDLHRYLGTLTIVFVAIHVAAVWLDSFVRIDVRQLFVPLASTWRPRAVAWGVFSMYVLVAIQVTSWGMRRLPRKLWHRVHVLSLPMLAAATVHGALAGSDRANRLAQWVVFAVGVGVVFLLSVRLLTPSRSARRRLTAVDDPSPRLREPAV